MTLHFSGKVQVVRKPNHQTSNQKLYDLQGALLMLACTEMQFIWDPALARSIFGTYCSEGTDTHPFSSPHSKHGSKPYLPTSPFALNEHGGHIHQHHITQHRPNLHTLPRFFNRIGQDSPPTMLKPYKYPTILSTAAVFLLICSIQTKKLPREGFVAVMWWGERERKRYAFIFYPLLQKLPASFW